MTLRQVFSWVAAAMSLVSLAAIVHMWRVAPRWLQVRRLRVGIVGLPTEWRGVRVAHLSDFHLGQKGSSTSVLWQAREAAIAFQPDMIALTGDFFDDGVWASSGNLFVNWDGIPTFAVLGNHDHRGGPEHVSALKRMLRDGGVVVLENDAMPLGLRGRIAWIAGVDDPYTGMSDVERAFSAIPEHDDALLLLAHAPNAAESMPVGRARLVVCGHTHGGQIRLLPSGRTPFLRLFQLALGEPPRNEPSIHHGEHWLRGALVLISNGLGMSQLPLRFRARPQVLLIELVEADPGHHACDDARAYVSDITPESWLARWMA